MLSPELFAALSNRSILDQRFATSLNKETTEILTDLAKWLRERINREGSTIASRKRYEKLLADIEKRTEQIYSDISELYEQQFKPFAYDEADFVAKSMQAVVAADVIVESPSNRALWNAITKNPLQIGGNNTFVDFDDLIKGLGVNSKKIASVISGGYSQGLTLDEMKQAIVGTRAQKYSDGIIDKSRREAESIVRTSINHIASTSRDEVYRQNDDIIWGYTILATLDTRTTPNCRYFDGKTYRYSDKYNPLPPFHHNCVLSGTVVSTCSRVDKLFKRAYKGIIVDIVTKSGRKLSITPNHPILTRGGWKLAKLIDSSDQLATVPEKVFICHDYKDSVKAEVSDLFSSAYVFSESASIADRPTSAEDFHGDVTDSKVGVINIDSLAWDRVKSAFSEKFKDNWFGARKFIHFTLSSVGGLHERFVERNSASCSDVSRPSVGFSFFRTHSVHAASLLLRPVSELSKLLFKNLFYGRCTAINAKVLGDTSKSDPDFISFDDVDSVSFRESSSSDHVYNLENKDNWYLSNGIITHNCRTQIVSEFYNEKLNNTGSTRSVNFKGGEDLKKGTTGQIDASKQYYDVLKRQPVSQQDAVLGKARGLIFRNSGLSSQEFRNALTDNMGNPLTLQQMANENKKILEYMNKNEFLSEYVGG